MSALVPLTHPNASESHFLGLSVTSSKPETDKPQNSKSDPPETSPGHDVRNVSTAGVKTGQCTGKEAKLMAHGQNQTPRKPRQVCDHKAAGLADPANGKRNNCNSGDSPPSCHM